MVAMAASVQNSDAGAALRVQRDAAAREPDFLFDVEEAAETLIGGRGEGGRVGGGGGGEGGGNGDEGCEGGGRGLEVGGD